MLSHDAVLADFLNLGGVQSGQGGLAAVSNALGDGLIDLGPSGVGGVAAQNADDLVPHSSGSAADLQLAEVLTAVNGSVGHGDAGAEEMGLNLFIGIITVTNIHIIQN